MSLLMMKHTMQCHYYSMRCTMQCHFLCNAGDTQCQSLRTRQTMSFFVWETHNDILCERDAQYHSSRCTMSFFAYETNNMSFFVMETHHVILRVGKGMFSCIGVCFCLSQLCRARLRKSRRSNRCCMSWATKSYCFVHAVPRIGINLATSCWQPVSSDCRRAWARSWGLRHTQGTCEHGWCVGCMV